MGYIFCRLQLHDCQLADMHNIGIEIDAGGIYRQVFKQRNQTPAFSQ